MTEKYHLRRIRQLEKKIRMSLKIFLYKMHWQKDMMHKDIGKILGIPRPTITRWFKKHGIPSKSCHRFTNKNLTNWPYIIGIKHKKIKGPDKRMQRTKGGINVGFFKTWTPEMAYVLGYFSADGGMFINSGGSKYIQFVSADYSLLEKVRNAIDSKHKIYLRKKYKNTWKNVYYLEIGSKEIYQDLLNLGFMPKKEARLKLPNIPEEYFNHFIRGYFDGDGCISYGFYKRKNRNTKSFVVMTRFISSSGHFLEAISKKLSIYAEMSHGSMARYIGYCNLIYSKNNSIKLSRYMYKNIKSNLFLERKFKKFEETFNILGITISKI